jgi:hypothetical protein
MKSKGQQKNSRAPKKKKQQNKTTKQQHKCAGGAHTQNPISSNGESNLQPKIRTDDCRKDFLFFFGLAKIVSLSLYCSFCFAAANSGAEDKRKRERKREREQANDKSAIKRCQELR